MGVDQARPKNTLGDAQVTTKRFFASFFVAMLEYYTIKHAVVFRGVIDSRWTITSVVEKNEATVVNLEILATKIISVSRSIDILANLNLALGNFSLNFIIIVMVGSSLLAV